MKTFYILIILLLSLSYSNAQSTTKVVEIESKVIIPISKMNNNEEFTMLLNNVSNEDSSINTCKVKAFIARTSDIRNYLNIKRNISNMGVLFPKINKIVKV